MKVFRLIRREFQGSDLGAGSKQVGGRWNPKGFEVIYTATSPYNAQSVMVAMAGGRLPPVDHVMVTIDLGQASYRGLTSVEFAEFRASDDFAVSQAIGERWLTKQDTCVLIVPSDLVNGINYVLINPQHPDFRKITIGSFESLAEWTARDFRWYDYADVRGVGDPSPAAPPAMIDEARPAFHVFISHASEDKVAVATPVAKALREKGLKPWLDEEQIGWGDSIERGVSKGLKESQFVILVLTPRFVRKEWTMAEYRSSFAAQMEKGDTRILPLVWAQNDAEIKIIFEALPL